MGHIKAKKPHHGIAFTGAHGVGKTTLAREVARRLDIPFLSTNTAAIFERLGLPAPSSWSETVNLSFEERMRAQDEIFECHLRDIERMDGTPFVADRSTLDFAAYPMCEWGMQACGGDDARLVKYVDRCMAVAGQLYTTLIQVQPGLPYVPASNRPRPSVSYQETFNLLISAMLYDKRVTATSFVLHRSDLSLEHRVERSLGFWAATRCLV